MTQGDEPLRDDHAELLRRRALTEDAARPDAVERRHASNGRTALAATRSSRRDCCQIAPAAMFAI
jgi:hypothetical protein